MAEESKLGDNPASAGAVVPAKKKAAKRKAKKVAVRARGAKKVVADRAPGVKKKSAAKAAKKTMTRKKTAKKKVSARAAVTAVAEPKAKPKSKKKAVARKARAKPMAAPESTPVVVGERRRGRPVSVDLLRQKLEKAQKTARTEKERRRVVAGKARKAIAEHVARNKRMRNELVATKRELDRVSSEAKSAEQARASEQHLEMARQVAVQQFLEGWEKEFLGKGATAKRRRGRPRGRPRGRKARS